MRLLCAADLHLGRQPSRLPPSLADRAEELGPRAAWQRTVSAAIDLGVDAVLLAGDVVDHDDDFFEAYADLRRGVERLADADIEVLAIAGNHDVEVLPRLARAVPQGFKLLGEGGTWESSRVTGRDGSAVRVLGWSFPQPRPTVDPLASLPRERAFEVTIGLLHGDRDQSGSPYASFRSADLVSAPVEAWLLGHIHKPDIVPDPRPMGYLGSLVGTDPGEPGAHGAWLLEVAPDGTLTLSQVPLAPLRWESLEVQLDDLAGVADVLPRITAALDTLPARLGGARPLAVGCRLRLTGRTAHPRAVADLVRDDRESIDHPLEGGARAFVHAVQLEVRPAYDLEALAAGADPAGLLARRLLLLQGHGEDAARSELLRSAQAELAEVVRRRYLADAHVGPPGPERTAELLESAAFDALEALLAQREDRA